MRSLLLLLLLPAPLLAGPDLPDRLAKAAPHAAGLALVEALDAKEHDARPGDGPLSLNVRLRILRSTGTTLETIFIVKAPGGHPGPNSAPWKPSGPVKLDTFAKGKRYFVSFASQYDWSDHPQGVLRVWPEADAPKVLAEAIDADLLAHRPDYDPASKFTHSSTTTNATTWTVRMERDGKLLWEVPLPGQRFKTKDWDGEWRLIHRDNWPSGLGNADATPSGRYLFAETTMTLAADNPYALPAGPHRLTYALAADTGKTAAIWVSIMRLGATSTPSVIHFFDLKTGKLRREERFDSLAEGGLAVGADDERWYRKTVRLIDPATGRRTAETLYRHATSPEGSKFVPIN